MKKIILASGSAQRKKLLSDLKIPFSVSVSSVHELTKIQTTCSALVKHNAVIKAQEVAGREKNGLVIGADTVVYLGGKEIIGKPKNHKDAIKILKKLFSNPHWVYSGVAVIDAKTGRKEVSYEKTKIYMQLLSLAEIKRYHQKVMPLDKAGGFDIEGWGSLFIKRIDGCYTNVIGLPLAKLHGMMKKFGVSLLAVFLMIIFSGCSTEYNLATQKQETLIYGTEKEVKIGDAISEKIEKQFHLNTDIDVNERVQKIFKKIVAVSDRTDIVYIIKIIDKDYLNAVSLPGGYIYLFQGILDQAKNDDQIAGVIAHEVGHITARHGIKRLQASYGALLLQIAAVRSRGSVARGLNLALTSVFMEYSQLAEFESDRLSVKYMKKAGYDSKEMMAFLKIMKDEKEKSSIGRFSYWKTHPNLAERISVVRQEITGVMDFRDYVQMIGNEQ